MRWALLGAILLFAPGAGALPEWACDANVDSFAADEMVDVSGGIFRGCLLGAAGDALYLHVEVDGATFRSAAGSPGELRMVDLAAVAASGGTRTALVTQCREATADCAPGVVLELRFRDRPVVPGRPVVAVQ